MSILLAVLLSGCQNAFGFINAKWISEITLDYEPLDGKQAAGPFESRTFTDPAFIKVMADAMNGSKRIQGKLDYGVEFRMKLTYGDGYTEGYILNLGEDRGNRGLLVPEDNSGKGYSVSVKNADKLRKLVYDEESSGADAGGLEAAQASVTVNGPVTVSRNDLLPVTGMHRYLNLQLLQGQYSEDWTTPSALGGRSWSGTFRLAVSDEQGEAISSFALSRYFTEELSFGELFQIRFGDYNGDGNPDFTIGQYGSSNGSFFKLFTLNMDNYSIRELNIQGATELFISSEDRHSVKLGQVDGGFKAGRYDNALGKQVEDLYRWDGNASKFIKQ
ncbi:hypothetical protein [Paenibacillus sp. S150]|uniref:hypothetical protein n=1 Tax=Paenibacillus sp. S150 TaxID=2749826 RepID=UPI001C574011|nr:hypothetical protein [Paenibacillus sp. S150]MBW4083061.1 hypothetical protein [Paenibacillus sp. S150]